MIDEELERAYHEMQLRKLGKSKQIEILKNTGRTFFHKQCSTCRGSGSIVNHTLDGWFVHYQYQDCNETSRPMTKDEAIKEYKECKIRDKSVVPTLIGDDGFVYILLGEE